MLRKLPITAQCPMLTGSDGNLGKTVIEGDDYVFLSGWISLEYFQLFYNVARCLRTGVAVTVTCACMLGNIYRFNQTVFKIEMALFRVRHDKIFNVIFTTEIFCFLDLFLFVIILSCHPKVTMSGKFCHCHSSCRTLPFHGNSVDHCSAHYCWKRRLLAHDRCLCQRTKWATGR